MMNDAFKRIQVNPYLLPCIKVYSKWIKDTLKSDVLNLIEEKVEKNLELLGTGKDFPNRILLGQALKFDNKWGLTKLRSVAWQRTLTSMSYNPSSL